MYCFVLASKSNTFKSGLVAVVSTKAASAGLVVGPYIAAAGTHIVSLPAIFNAEPFPCKTPDPFGTKFIPTLVSPDAVKLGLLPVAALAYVNSLTAELVAVNKNNSFPLVSKIEVPILGAVKVLFVKVCVQV